jgi:glycosyltransferase involved in cell wall biosynthesis
MSRRSLSDYQLKMRFGTAIESILHRYMTAILGNSKSVVRQLQNDEQVPSKRLGLIYNGIDLAPYRDASTTRTGVRGSLNIHQDALVFVTVANLIPYKGHHDLLIAFSGASPRLPVGWRVLMIGRDDGIGVKLREQAASLGIAENVMFLGSRSDVPDLLRSADVAVLASHQEGFSNAILESMAAGLPMIATDVGGNPEAVLEGKTGFIVPPRAPEQMSEAIIRLSADAELRVKMGVMAADRVEKEFGLEACASRYEDLYNGLLGGKCASEIRSIRFLG